MCHGPDPDQIHRLEIPEGIREVGGGVVPASPTGPTARWRLAAVIGREFDRELAATLSMVPTPTSSSTTSTRPWRRASLVEAPSVFGRYAFSHALIRQTLYEELNATRRSRIHRQVAEALVERRVFAGGACVPFHRGPRSGQGTGRFDRQLPRSRAARSPWRKPHGTTNTHSNFGRKSTTPRARPAVDRPELLRRAAEVTWLLDGGLARAIDLAMEAERAVDPQSNPIRAGMIAERLGTYLQIAGRGNEAIAAVERAIELIPADPPSSERARALATLAGMLMLFSRNREAEERSKEAIEVARTVGDHSAEAHALVTLGTVEGSTEADRRGGCSHSSGPRHLLKRKGR